MEEKLRFKVSREGGQRIANRILQQMPNIRDSAHYERVSETMIDLTMSCNRQEAIGHMDTWMAAALEQGKKSVNEDLRCKFLAAYDLREELIKGANQI